RLNRMTDHLLDAQSQLVRSEKLASIGRLAAGIAHEVGNPLGAIGTYVEVLRRRGTDQEIVAGMARELERMDRIVRGLLDYARPRDEPLAPLDPGAVLRAAFGLLEAQGALKAVRATLDIAGEPPPIRGRAHLLEQALVNLVLNAVDAAPGGVVVLGARRWAYEPDRAAPKRADDPARTAFPRGRERRPARIEFAPGQPGALLFVADSGPGVPPQDREAIFEPFYTTKPPGRGTGLGLAIVARAVHDMGGVVWVDTAREGGAAFKMFFPAAPGGAACRGCSSWTTSPGCASRSACCSPTRATTWRPRATPRVRSNAPSPSRSTWCCATSGCRASTASPSCARTSSAAARLWSS